jgi:hypothetical protein
LNKSKNCKPFSTLNKAGLLNLVNKLGLGDTPIPIFTKEEKEDQRRLDRFADTNINALVDARITERDKLKAQLDSKNTTFNQPIRLKLKKKLKKEIKELKEIKSKISKIKPLVKTSHKLPPLRESKNKTISKIRPLVETSHKFKSSAQLSKPFPYKSLSKPPKSSISQIKFKRKFTDIIKEQEGRERKERKEQEERERKERKEQKARDKESKARDKENKKKQKQKEQKAKDKQEQKERKTKKLKDQKKAQKKRKRDKTQQEKVFKANNYKFKISKLTSKQQNMVRTINKKLSKVKKDLFKNAIVDDYDTKDVGGYVELVFSTLN